MLIEANKNSSLHLVVKRQQLQSSQKSATYTQNAHAHSSKYSWKK